MPLDVSMPHLEEPDLGRLKRSADQAAAEPLRVQIAESEKFLLQLRGICAEHDVPVPASLDKALFAWLHQQASQGDEKGRSTS